MRPQISAVGPPDVADPARRGVGELRVDGAASANDLLMQIQADVAGVRVVRSRIAETTALGAAYLAGLATGFWSEGEIDRQWQADRRFEPRKNCRELRERWQAAVGKL